MTEFDTRKAALDVRLTEMGDEIGETITEIARIEVAADVSRTALEGMHAEVGQMRAELAALTCPAADGGDTTDGGTNGGTDGGGTDGGTTTSPDPDPDPDPVDPDDSVDPGDDTEVDPGHGDVTVPPVETDPIPLADADNPNIVATPASPTIYAPLSPDLPPLKDERPALFLLLKGISTTTRYDRNEHGKAVREPITLRAFVSKDAGGDVTDTYRPSVRYVIDGEHRTEWLEWPDYGWVFDPAEWGPGSHSVEIEAEIPGYKTLSEVTPILVPGKTGPQTLRYGPHKYDLVAGIKRGTGRIECEWSGGSWPQPLKHREATPYSEAKKIDDLWVQAIQPYTVTGIFKPSQSRGGDGSAPSNPQYYYAGSVQGRKFPITMGERGQCTPPPVLIDGHISKAGNCYGLATTGTLFKTFTTGKQELLAGWYNEHGSFEGIKTWPNPDNKFHGRFMNNSKPGWWEPWAMAFDDSIEVTPDAGHPSGLGGFHQKNIMCMVGDTLHGDVDVVVWHRDLCPAHQVPRIYTIAHAIGEVWGVAWDKHRRRWWVTIRSSVPKSARVGFPAETAHRIVYFDEADVIAFINGDAASVPMHVFYQSPVDPPANISHSSGSWRSAGPWPAWSASKRADEAANRRAWAWKPGGLDEAIFPFPETIKVHPDGRLFVSSQYLAIIAVIDVEARDISMAMDALPIMGDGSYWLTFSLDDGNSGPEGYIRLGSWARWKFPQGGLEGEDPVRLWSQSGHLGHVGLGKDIWHPNYPIGVIVGNGAIWMSGGHHGLLRATLPRDDDPVFDERAVRRGQDLYAQGTTPDREPTRPSMWFKHGHYGVDYMGGEPFRWEVPPEIAGNEQHMSDLLAYYDYCRSGTAFEDRERVIDGNVLRLAE